jgi:hypothetical protein
MAVSRQAVNARNAFLRTETPYRKDASEEMASVWPAAGALFHATQGLFVPTVRVTVQSERR